MIDKAVFDVRADRNSWAYKNLIVLRVTASGWLVYITGEEVGCELQDTITCYVPSLFVLYDFLQYFTQGKQPVFSSVAEFKPLT